jgi:CheY-like chemotaxis protein
VSALVVDDDVAGAAALCSILSREGCDARAVRTAEEALALLTAFPAQAVVLNLVLPRMSGLLLARRLKANPATGGIVLFSMSPAYWSDAEEIAREVGCVAHLSKPVAAQPFLETFVRLVEGRA